VLVGVCFGFVGNRMLEERGREADKLVLEGALPQQIDKVLYDFGFPMGPFAMHDLAGLDVSWRIRKGLGKKSAVADRLCELGRFGQKTGAGYYRYGADRAAAPDPEVERIILEASSRLGIERRPIADDEILARLLYPMVNEGAKILDEKIALRASDIDTVWINGYGFPSHRGGPMFYADTVGLPKILATIRGFREKHGKVWTPSPLLERLAAEGKTFASLDAEGDAS
jgi:3-hydroxyacyl-CoA dehydrogenase